MIRILPIMGGNQVGQQSDPIHAYSDVPMALQP